MKLDFLPITLFLLAMTSTHCFKKSWCWTKNMANEEAFFLNEAHGGMNWGFCRDENFVKVTYTVTINISPLIHTGEKTVIKFISYSETYTSPHITLASLKQYTGPTITSTFKSRPLGIIKKIKLYLDENSKSQLRCTTVLISSSEGTFNFDCTKTILPCGVKCGSEIFPDGGIPYEVDVTSAHFADNAIKSIVKISLFGSKGFCRNKIFNESSLLPGGKVHKKKFKLNDIGDITGFRLSLESPAKWKVYSFSVTNTITKQSWFFPLENTELQFPGNRASFLKILPQAGDELGDISTKAFQADDLTNVFYGDYNESSTPGVLLTQKEKNSVIKLFCEQTLLSGTVRLFGPDFPTKMVNFQTFLASCPSNCHLSPSTPVIGQGSHPQESPICLSAIYDRAMPIYGGIIAISIYKGMAQYPVNRKIKQSYGDIGTIQRAFDSSKSYSVSKVDNIDLIESDVRIVNFQGELSSNGRIEMRRLGRWGSICITGCNEESANVICKKLGFSKGEWKNYSSSQASSFCRSYHGLDYCATKDMPIHFSHIHCLPANTFDNCYKKTANYFKCSHDDDAIISCTKGNKLNDDDIPEGVVKLGANNTVDKDNQIIGRVDIRSNNKFLPLCNRAITLQTVFVICTTMGYSSGEIENDVAQLQQLQYNPGSPIAFAAFDFQCRGDEKQLRDCIVDHTENSKCSHDMDLVVRCKGNGDPSGDSQWKSVEAAEEMKLGKLGIQDIEITCEMTGTDVLSKGDPGSIFLVKCPSGCRKHKGFVTGSGYYNAHSNICLSAVHAGALDDNQGGSVMITKSFGHGYYEGSSGSYVNSMTSRVYSSFSFFFSSLNSSWIRMNKLYRMKARLTKEKLSHMSFLELKSPQVKHTHDDPIPIFTYFPNTLDYQFSFHHNEILQKSLGSKSMFTILIKFELAYFFKNKQFLFSYSGCHGFNIYLNTEGELSFGDPCNLSRNINTGIEIPVDEKIILYVSYVRKKLTYVLFDERRKQKEKLADTVEMEMLFPAGNTIGIGRQGKKKVMDNFNGYIDYVFIFDQVIPSERVEEVCEKVENENRVYKSMQRRVTVDNRKCVSVCTDSQGPPSENILVPPEQATLLTSQRQSHGNEISHLISLYSTTENSQLNNIQAQGIICSNNLLNLNFHKFSPGSLIRVRCPSCFDERMTIYGTDIYHPISSICIASLHMGLFDTSSLFTDLIIKILPGVKAYNGSTGKNKITSGSFGAANVSFTLLPAPKFVKITCMQTVNEGYLKNSPLKMKFVVKCPMNCSKVGKVYGTDIYKDSSAICRSAIHKGLINDLGGEVSFEIHGGANWYHGSTRFGVESVSLPGYIRSFRFVDTGEMSLTYSEKFIGSLWANWESVANDYHNDRVTSRSSASSSSSFLYSKVDEKDFKGNIKQSKAISHISQEESNNNVTPMSLSQLSSLIKLKTSSWSNGVISFNIISRGINASPFGVLFRFQDIDHFLGILFNFASSKIFLVSNILGVFTVIETHQYPLLPNRTYCGKIISHFNQIYFNIRLSDQHAAHYLINRTISDIQSKGSIALASFGNSKFDVTLLAITPFNRHVKDEYVDNKRSWKDILKERQEKDRVIYCGNMFRYQVKEIPQCVDRRNYCKIRCDSEISVIENILNFACFKACLKE